MARPSSSFVKGVVAFSGMVTVLGAFSMVPRVSIFRNEDMTVLRYQHKKTSPSNPPPSNQGLIISPSEKYSLPDPSKSPNTTRTKTVRENDWIFDTGATTHVCTNRSLLHSYSSYSHTRFSKSVGYFGPNPIQIMGIGDCTLDLPGATAMDGSDAVEPISKGLSNPLTPYFNPQRQPPLYHDNENTRSEDRTSLPPGYRTAGRITIRNVSHIPSAGINIISWSQLKRTKGMNLSLIENEDGSLGIVKEGRRPVQIMRFELRDGLYFLDRGEGKG